MDTFLQQVINGVTAGSVYAIVALGYTMVYGIIQLINFAHGEVVMIGAMVAFTVITTIVGAHTSLPPLAIVIAGASRDEVGDAQRTIERLASHGAAGRRRRRSVR